MKVILRKYVACRNKSIVNFYLNFYDGLWCTLYALNYIKEPSLYVHNPSYISFLWLQRQSKQTLQNYAIVTFHCSLDFIKLKKYCFRFFLSLLKSPPIKDICVLYHKVYIGSKKFGFKNFLGLILGKKVCVPKFCRVVQALKVLSQRT